MQKNDDEVLVVFILGCKAFSYRREGLISPDVGPESVIRLNVFLNVAPYF
jgi:hypothetical protein